jgi:hypothetical protein
MVMADFYLQSTKRKEVKFKILSFNKETGDMLLQGQFKKFEEKGMTRERMERYGYKIEKVETT